MNLGKPGAVDAATVTAARTSAASSVATSAASATPAVRGATQGGEPGAQPVLTGDRASIQPLDEQGALQILVAEAELAMTEALVTQAPASARVALLARLTPDGTALGSAPADALTRNVMRLTDGVGSQVWQLVAANAAGALEQRAAGALLTAWLHVMPAEGSGSPRLVAALEDGIARALQIIAGWRDTPESIALAVSSGAAVAMTVIRDEFGAPILLRPEWAGFAPQVRELRRRKRRFALEDDLDATFDEDPSADSGETEYRSK